MTAQLPPKAVLFDIGGVVVGLEFVDRCSNLLIRLLAAVSNARHS